MGKSTISMGHVQLFMESISYYGDGIPLTSTKGLYSSITLR